MLIAETLTNNKSVIINTGKPEKVTYKQPLGGFYFETDTKRIFLGYSLKEITLCGQKLKSLVCCTICDKDFSHPEFYYAQDIDTSELMEKCGLEIKKADGTIKWNIDPVGKSEHIINAVFSPTWGVTLGDNSIPSCSKGTKVFHESDMVMLVAMDDATFAAAELFPNILSAEETGYLLSHTYFSKEGEHGFFRSDFSNNKNTKLKYKNYMVIVYPGYKDYFVRADNG
jgi:hypothetical protein